MEENDKGEGKGSILARKQTSSRYNETQFPAVGAETEPKLVVSFVLAKSFTPHADCVKQSYLRGIR